MIVHLPIDLLYGVRIQPCQFAQSANNIVSDVILDMIFLLPRQSVDFVIYQDLIG